MTGVIFGTFFFVMAIGCPIGVALLLGGTIPIMTMTDIPLLVIGQRMFSSMNSYTIMAVPFYILAGNLMDCGGVSRRLVGFARSLVGWMPGGLAVVSFLACVFFGAISGSSPATVAAIGTIMIPSMKEEGYPLPFILATIASGGWLGIIIPPSIPMVMYCISVGGVSITEVFMAGFLPGFLLAGGMSVYAVLYGRKHKLPITPFSFQNVCKSFRDALWAIGMPIILLGGIYGGIFTATEAAAVAVAYGFLVSALVYKQLTFKLFVSVVRRSVIVTIITMFIVSTATVFGYIMTREQIPAIVAEFIMSIAHNRFTFYVLVTLLLLIVGTFMEMIPAIMILAPVLKEMLAPYGVNPTAFGVIMVVNLGIGMVTPPVGLNLFTAAGLVGEKIERVVNRHLFAYMGFAMVVLVLLILFEDIIMFLPKLLLGS